MYNLIQKKKGLKQLKILLYYFDGLVLFFLKKSSYSDRKKKKVLIIYNLALGDGVIFNCSASDYRKVYPSREYEITFMCQNGVENLYKNNNLFDKIINIDFNKAAVNPIYRIRTLKKIREVYYDIVVDPIGIFDCTTNVLMVRASLGKEKIGIIDNNKAMFLNKKYINKIYTKTYLIKKKKILSLIEYYQVVINMLSDGRVNHNVGFKEMNLDKPKIKLPKSYFVIFPSASIELKRWPIERYREIARRVYSLVGMPLVVCGTTVDMDSVNLLIDDLGIEVINLLCKTNLNDYFYIIKNAAFVITNDTSAYHVAVVNQTPVVIVSGGYDFDRYICYDFKRKNEFKRPYVVAKRMKCFNCNEKCPFFNHGDKNWKCLDQITVDMVFDSVYKLLVDEGICE